MKIASYVSIVSYRCLDSGVIRVASREEDEPLKVVLDVNTFEFAEGS
jgi:hypothetical protein